MTFNDAKKMIEAKDLSNLIIDSDFFYLGFSYYSSDDTMFKIQPINEYQKEGNGEILMNHFFTLKSNFKSNK